MEPIKNENSVNFIERELIKRQKLNILFWEDHYIKFYSSTRDLTKMGNFISNYAKESDIFPIYVFLNIQYDNKDGKHSELIIITKNHSKYNVGFFDSNGQLSQTNKFKPDLNVLHILDIVSKNLDADFFEFMEGKQGINIIGKGNCDAFCLWLVYLNKKSNSKTDVLEIFNKFYQDIKKDNLKDYIIEMNENIIEKSKKR
jgi:hypothetical protein